VAGNYTVSVNVIVCLCPVFAAIGTVWCGVEQRGMGRGRAYPPNIQTFASWFRLAKNDALFSCTAEMMKARNRSSQSPLIQHSCC